MSVEEYESLQGDRMHLPKKMTEHQVWYGPEMVNSDEWLYSLSDGDIDEIWF